LVVGGGFLFGGDGGLLAVGRVGEADGDVFVVAARSRVAVGVVFDLFGDSAGVVELRVVFFVGGVDRFVSFAVVVVLGGGDEDVIAASGNGRRA